METEVGGIGNSYGGLSIKQEEDGTKWWGIENYNGIRWEQIPSNLYNSLLNYSKQYKNQQEENN